MSNSAGGVCRRSREQRSPGASSQDDELGTGRAEQEGRSDA
jgi:hypothetical protein